MTEKDKIIQDLRIELERKDAVIRELEQKLAEVIAQGKAETEARDISDFIIE